MIRERCPTCGRLHSLKAERDVIYLPSHWADKRRKAALARAASLSPERRQEIGRIAAAARWRQA